MLDFDMFDIRITLKAAISIHAIMADTICVQNKAFQIIYIELWVSFSECRQWLVKITSKEG